MDKPNILFKAFADETRLRILNLLGHRDQCVCELQYVLRQPQSKISRHLALLRRSGLIVDRREGKWVIYSLAKPGTPLHASLVHCVKTCFRDVDNLKQDAERARKMKPLRCC